jgi:hypothetical protein
MVEEGETAPLLHTSTPERNGRLRNQIAELDAHNSPVKNAAGAAGIVWPGYAEATHSTTSVPTSGNDNMPSVSAVERNRDNLARPH